MNEWMLKGAILQRALEVAGGGALREAAIVTEGGDEVLLLPRHEGGEPARWSPADLQALIERRARDRQIRVVPLTIYGRPSGKLVLALDSDEAVERVDEVISAVVDLVVQLAEMDLEIESLSGEVLRSYEAINFFYDLHSVLAGTMDPTVLSRTILARLMDAVACRGGLIVLAEDGREPRSVVRAARLESDRIREGETFTGGSLLDIEVITEGRAVVVDRVMDLSEERLGDLLELAQVSLAMAPLRWEGKSLGAVALADRLGSVPDGRPGPFSSADLKLLETIATQAAAILCYTKLMALQKEIETAQRIQTSLLPAAAPEVEGVDLAGRCKMAGGVGGDLFDYSLRPDGSVRLVVADVSGHNLASALMMTMARTALKIAGRSRRSPAAIAGRLNSDLFEDLSQAELFITMFLAGYSPARGVLTYCSAGHNPALLLRAGKGGRIESLKAAGVPAGILPSFAFEERSTRLGPGDVVMIYTDGLSEARGRGGDILGEPRLARMLRRHAGGTAPQIVERVLEDVEHFSVGRPGDDDRTLVVLKVRGGAGRSGPDQAPPRACR